MGLFNKSHLLVNETDNHINLSPNDSLAAGIVCKSYTLLSYARDIYAGRQHMTAQDLKEIRDLLESVIDQMEIRSP